MEPKRINVLFSLVLLFFLALIFILIRDFNAKRASDVNDLIRLSNVVKQQNAKIRTLYSLLGVKEGENVYLKKTLQETKSDLDALSNRLTPSQAQAQ